MYWQFLKLLSSQLNTTVGFYSVANRYEIEKLWAATVKGVALHAERAHNIIMELDSGAAFREHISTIFSLLTVESTLVNAANELYANGLITQDTHTDVTTHLIQPTRQRASLLIAAVGATLKASPEKEQSVLQILDTNNQNVFSFQNTETDVAQNETDAVQKDESDMTPSAEAHEPSSPNNEEVSIDSLCFSRQLEIIHEVLDAFDDQLKQLQLHYYLSGNIIPKERIRSLHAKITKCMIAIPLIGVVNAGKTTIINALLGGTYLPIGMRRTTLVRTYIKHDPNVHSKPCQSPPCEHCPKLFKSLQETDLLVSGTEKQIHDEVMKRNKEAIDKEEHLALVLTVNIPCFSQLSLHHSLAPYLVDCCGVEWVEQDTQGFLSVTSSVIAVLNFKDMERQNLDNANIISGSNLENIFVVSQFDAFYDVSNSSCPDTALTKEQCIDNLKAIIGNVAEKENIFFLSGKWALNSRIYLKKPMDKDSRRVVTRAWEDYTTKFKYEEQDVENDKTYGENVEKISEIVFLEKKLLQLFSQINLRKWSKEIDEDCSCLLNDAIDVGKYTEQDIIKKSHDLSISVEKSRSALTTIHEQNHKLTMWCQDQTISEQFHKYIEEKAKEWWEAARISLPNVITKHISQLKESHPKSYELETFAIDLRILENEVLPKTILKLFKEDAGGYMRVYINHCQFEQNECFQRRNQAIFILTNIVVEPSQFYYTTEEENLDREDPPTEVMVFDEPPEYWNTLSRQLRNKIPKLSLTLSVTKYKETLLRDEHVDKTQAELISEITKSTEIADAAMQWFIQTSERKLLESFYIKKMKQDAIDSMGDYQRFWASKVDAKEMQVEEEEKEIVKFNTAHSEIRNIVDQIQCLLSKLEEARPA